MERFGETGSGVANRIDQLRQTKKELSQLLDTAIGKGQSFTINCTIDLAVQPEDDR